jgi:hypothetical protein
MTKDSGSIKKWRKGRDCWAWDTVAPVMESRLKSMRTGHKQGEMWLTCFSKIGIAPAAEQLFLWNCVQIVTMSRPSLRASAPPCLLLFIKGPLKEEKGLCLGFFALEGFFGSLAWFFCFGLFGVGSFFGREMNY